MYLNNAKSGYLRTGEYFWISGTSNGKITLPLHNPNTGFFYTNTNSGRDLKLDTDTYNIW